MNCQGKGYLQRQEVLVRFAALFICVVSLGGCAITPAQHDAMIPMTVDTAKGHTQSVSVAVSGAREMKRSFPVLRISDQSFSQALVDTIIKTRAFSRVAAGSNVDYSLQVVLLSLEEPGFGASLTVKLEARWTLQRVDTGAIVWQDLIKAEHTAKWNEAFSGITRGRMAIEGAVRENIAEGLARISRLDL